MNPKLILFLPLLGLGLLLPMASARAGETNRLNGVAALVNDAVITEQEVYSELEKELPRLRSLYANQPGKFREELSRARAAWLEILVERQLVLADYKAAGFNIPETLIEDQFQEFMIRSFGDRVTYVKTLQKQGKTIEEARKEYRDSLIIDIMSSQKIRNQVTISPFKIERYYQQNQEKFSITDQVKLRMILLPVRAGEGEVVLAKARDLHRQIKEGASFADLAKQHSTGAYAKDGGLMGMSERNKLRKEINDAAFALKAGDVSEPIVTEDAIFIVKVEEFKPAHVTPLAEVRDEIEQTLQSEESARRRKQWIQGIREKAFIRYF